MECCANQTKIRFQAPVNCLVVANVQEFLHLVKYLLDMHDSHLTQISVETSAVQTEEWLDPENTRHLAISNTKNVEYMQSVIARF